MLTKTAAEIKAEQAAAAARGAYEQKFIDQYGTRPEGTSAQTQAQQRSWDAAYSKYMAGYSTTGTTGTPGTTGTTSSTQLSASDYIAKMDAYRSQYGSGTGWGDAFKNYATQQGWTYAKQVSMADYMAMDPYYRAFFSPVADASVPSINQPKTTQTGGTTGTTGTSSPSSNTNVGIALPTKPVAPTTPPDMPSPSVAIGAGATSQQQFSAALTALRQLSNLRSSGGSSSPGVSYNPFSYLGSSNPFSTSLSGTKKSLFGI